MMGAGRMGAGAAGPDDGGVPTPRDLRRVAAVALVLGVPFAVAWLVGDLSTTAATDPDYAIRPPDIPAPVGQLLGALSLALVVAASAALAWSWHRDPPQPGLLSVLLPFVALGAICGFAWRVTTAAVIGANIGTGLVVMFGCPFVVGLLILSGVSAWARR